MDRDCRPQVAFLEDECHVCQLPKSIYVGHTKVEVASSVAFDFQKTISPSLEETFRRFGFGLLFPDIMA